MPSTPKNFPSFWSSPAVTDFATFERDVYRAKTLAADSEVVNKLQSILQEPDFLTMLQVYACQNAMKYEGMRKVNIRLASGNSYAINSPLFVKARPKDRRRSKRRKNVCFHLGLLYLGIFEHSSPTLISRALSLAALCPSFDTACDALRLQGIKMTHTLLQHLTYKVTDCFMRDRAANVVCDHYRKPGLRILIAIDGGRLRERTQKKGPKPKAAKRKGYTTEWREPKLFTICLIDEQGNKLKDVPPIYDGAVTGPDEIFQILTDYLRQIDYRNADAVVFCADGGPWIWPRTEQIIKDLEIPNAHRILDYTHAKQNLMEIANRILQAGCVPANKYDALVSQMKDWLWNGRIDKIEQYIKDTLRGKRSKKQALKKLNDYFGDHDKFRYCDFYAAGLPTGSGAIESAIRRIINLRIKGPGIFWLLPNADRMIFLRSQVLSGRWLHVIRSATLSWRNTLQKPPLQSVSKAA